MILIFTIVLTIYVVVGTVIAILSRRYGVRNLQDYFVAGYRLSGLLASMTYAATTYSAFMMVGLVGLAFQTGVVAFGFEIIYLLSTIVLLSTIGLKIWSVSRQRKWISPTDMLSDLYSSRKLGFIISIVYLIAIIPYISAQFKGIGEIFDHMIKNYNLGVLVALILILLWIVIAGVWSVATTDAYQGIWMITSSTGLITWILLFLLPSKNTSLEKVFNALTNTSTGNLLEVIWPITIFINYTIPWVFFALTNPQVVQRLYMPRDKYAYRRMLLFFSIFGLLYTVIVTLIGLIYRGFLISNRFNDLENYLLQRDKRDAITPTLLAETGELFASIVSISIVAAAVSTANSIILTVTSSIVREFYEKTVSKPVEKKSFIISTISIIIMSLAAMFIALIKPAYIIELSVISSVMLLPLAPITIVGFCKKQSSGAIYAYISLILGFVITLVLSILYGPSRVLGMSYLNIPIVLWVLVLSTIPLLPLLFKK